MSYIIIDTKRRSVSTPFVGILDTNPSSRPCYSVSRLLKASYAGSPCIRVKRDSDNAEQDIGFVDGLLDTASLTSFVGAATGYVVTWYDQNTSSNLTTAGTQFEPTIINTGTLSELNSLPSLYFHSSPRRQLQGSSVADWKFLSDGTQSQIYIVMSNESASTTSIMGTNTTGTSAAVGYWLHQVSANNLRTVTSNGSGFPVINAMTGGVLPFNQSFLFTGILDQSNATAAERDSIQIDAGTPVKNNAATVSPSAANPANPLTLGSWGTPGQGIFIGHMSELLFY